MTGRPIAQAQECRVYKKTRTRSRVSSAGVKQRSLRHSFLVTRLPGRSRAKAGHWFHRFFFAQAATRSSALSMFSIELATLKRK